MSDVRYQDCPQGLRQKLVGYLDFCCPECFWRRRFVRNWMDRGLDAAYADWRAEAPIQNPDFLPRVTQTIEEIKEWRSKPFPS